MQIDSCLHINLERAKYSAEMEVFMKGLKDFFREEEGVAIIEIVLILVNIFTMGFQMQCFQWL